jgi:glycosyltransferase involved in cell wall biosynthesis
MLTILLTTLNGGGTIGRTLAAFAKLRRPASPWRLIVVDGGSTDRTLPLIDRYRGALPVTVLRDATPGPWAGLNRALRLARHGLVVFTDDDVVPEADWLRNFEAAAAARTAFALFAGRTLPLWERAPPAWILDAVDLAASYGIHRDRAEGPCPAYLLYGANMAIRAEAIGATAFDHAYGAYEGGRFQLCGETDFVRRLARQGHEAWFCRDAVLRHWIPCRHMRAEWLLRRAADFGRGQCRVDGDPALSPRQGRLNAAIALRRAIAESRLRAGAAALRRDAKARFQALWRLYYLSGYAAQAQAARKRRRSPSSRPTHPAAQAQGVRPLLSERGSDPF